MYCTLRLTCKDELVCKAVPPHWEALYLCCGPNLIDGEFLEMDGEEGAEGEQLRGRGKLCAYLAWNFGPKRCCSKYLLSSIYSR